MHGCIISPEIGVGVGGNVWSDGYIVRARASIIGVCKGYWVHVRGGKSYHAIYIYVVRHGSINRSI